MLVLDQMKVELTNMKDTLTEVIAGLGLDVLLLELDEVAVGDGYHKVAQHQHYHGHYDRAVQVGSQHAAVADARAEDGYYLGVARHLGGEIEHRDEDEERAVEVYEAGYEVARRRSIETVGRQLKRVYEAVLEGRVLEDAELEAKADTADMTMVVRKLDALIMGIAGLSKAIATMSMKEDMDNLNYGISKVNSTLNIISGRCKDMCGCAS